MDSATTIDARRPRKAPRAPKSNSSATLLTNTFMDPASVPLPSPAPTTPGEDIFHTSMQVPTLGTLASTERSKSGEQPPTTVSAADAQDAVSFHTAGPYFPESSTKIADPRATIQTVSHTEDLGPAQSLTLPEINITSPTHASFSPLNERSLSSESVIEATIQPGDNLIHIEPIPHIDQEAAATTVLDTMPCKMDREPLAQDLSDPEVDLWLEEPVDNTDRVLLIGISGSPASGKSTILNMLKLILPSADPIFCVHQDDFDLPESVMNLDVKGGYHEECIENTDWESMRWVLSYAKRKRRLPLHYTTKHDEQKEKIVATAKIDVDLIDGLHAKLESSRYLACTTIGLVIGPLLYHDPEIEKLLDIRLFMHVDKQTALTRTVDRMRIDSFEQEEASKKLFETKLWPSYVQTHAPLFKNNDVEAELNLQLMDKFDIIPQPALSAKIQATRGFDANLQWAYKEILRAVRRINIEQLSNEKHRKRSGRYKPCDCQDGWLGKVRKVIFDFL